MVIVSLLDRPRNKRRPCGWRLKANRCPRLRLQIAPQVTHLPLDRPQAQSDPLLPLKLLPNHIGVAVMSAEPLRPHSTSPASFRGRPPPR
jgi:hypothetical protein